MTTSTAPALPGTRIKSRIVDGDVHHALPTRKALTEYLPSRWHQAYDFHRWGGESVTYSTRPRAGPYREDARPLSGLTPGSDLDLMRRQLLDRWNIEFAILSGLDVLSWIPYGDLAAALTSAYNDWTLKEWLEPEDRLYASIAIPTEDPIAAAREVHRLGDHPRFVNVMTVARTREPLGNPKYWPLYEAAEAHGLPIVIHVGSSGTAPVTGVGWPSYFIEQHMSLVHPYIAHVVSLVFNGVFDRFPRLKVVLEEGGIAWMPSLMWRLDRAWRMFPGDSRLESSPSTVIRKHFWFTTQPIDEAEKPEYFAQMLNHLDMDENVVFATDYPHWDFDSPDRALPAMVAGERRKKIMRTNALALYRFPSQPSSKE